jgi:hypothetical protein
MFMRRGAGCYAVHEMDAVDVPVIARYDAGCSDIHDTS